MIIGVVGSRGFRDYKLLERELDVLQSKKRCKITEIVSGGADGADTLAELYALRHFIPLTIYYPDWDQYGRSAGPRRNRDIVQYSDEILAFWDGISPGTKSTINIAKRMNKLTSIIFY